MSANRFNGLPVANQKERWTKNLIAITVTVTINCLISTFADSIGLDVEVFGLFFCPIFGGLVRSLVSNRRDVWWITLAIAALDIILFVPMVLLIGGYTSDFWDGLGHGVMAAIVMLITSFIALGIRALVYHTSIKPNLPSSVTTNKFSSVESSIYQPNPLMKHFGLFLILYVSIKATDLLINIFYYLPTLFGIIFDVAFIALFIFVLINNAAIKTQVGNKNFDLFSVFYGIFFGLNVWSILVYWFRRFYSMDSALYSILYWGAVWIAVVFELLAWLQYRIFTKYYSSVIRSKINKWIVTLIIVVCINLFSTSIRFTFLWVYLPHYLYPVLAYIDIGIMVGYLICYITLGYFIRGLPLNNKISPTQPAIITNESLIQTNIKETDNKICDKCGTSIVSEVEFCPECGNKVGK